jgi:sRNA-binding carbon storage regulator CsrA
MGKNAVEVGISAPRSYSIFRKEVFLEIQEKNVEAIKSIETAEMPDIQNIKLLLGNIEKDEDEKE